MNTDSLKLGEAKYDQLTPGVREFFDVVSSRLADAEVLFSADLPAISTQVNTGWLPARATTVFTTAWSKNVLLYMNVSLADEVFRPGSKYRRLTYFDKQHQAEDLQIEDALLHRQDVSIIESFDQPMLRGIANWRIRATGHHHRFIREAERGL